MKQKPSLLTMIWLISIPILWLISIGIVVYRYESLTDPLKALGWALTCLSTVLYIWWVYDLFQFITKEKVYEYIIDASNIGNAYILAIVDKLRQEDITCYPIHTKDEYSIVVTSKQKLNPTELINLGKYIGLQLAIIDPYILVHENIQQHCFRKDLI